MVLSICHLALRILGLNGGRLLLPSLGYDILHDDLQLICTIPQRAIHHLLVGGSHTLGVDTPQKYQPSTPRRKYSSGEAPTRRVAKRERRTPKNR